MVYLKHISLTLTLLMASLNCFSEDPKIVVVVNKNNPTIEMTRSQVIDLFMGRYVAFPNGTNAIPVDLKGDGKLKQEFYSSLVGMSLARVNSYWSRIKFTGRVKPSIKKSNQGETIRYISKKRNAIGYISKSHLNDNLKVIYTLNE